MGTEALILRQACATLQSLTEQIEGVVGMLPGDNMPTLTDAAKVRRLLSLRRDRERYFDASIFGEPAWDGLLELYLADIMHQPMTATGFCTGSRVPFTTALRVIDRLDELGIVQRTEDPRDRRKAIIRFTPSGQQKMSAYMNSAQ